MKWKPSGSGFMLSSPSTSAAARITAGAAARFNVESAYASEEETG
jgi:hypothetical protein